jgi:hypothetical protein
VRSAVMSPAKYVERVAAAVDKIRTGRRKS